MKKRPGIWKEQEDEKSRREERIMKRSRKTRGGRRKEQEKERCWKEKGLMKKAEKERSRRDESEWRRGAGRKEQEEKRSRKKKKQDKETSRNKKGRRKIGKKAEGEGQAPRVKRRAWNNWKSWGKRKAGGK
jgi:hypothetical protein